MRPALTAMIVAAAGTAALAATTDTAERIAVAFEEKGMERAQAECYGESLTAALSQEEAERAATIVEGATTRDGIKEEVKEGGVVMVTAFLDAETECGR